MKYKITFTDKGKKFKTVIPANNIEAAIVLFRKKDTFRFAIINSIIEEKDDIDSIIENMNDDELTRAYEKINEFFNKSR